MIQLIIDYDADLGFWYFVVKEDGEVICFRPGFRTKDEAATTGDSWIKVNLGATAANEDDIHS